MKTASRIKRPDLFDGETPEQRKRREAARERAGKAYEAKRAKAAADWRESLTRDRDLIRYGVQLSSTRYCLDDQGSFSTIRDTTKTWASERYARAKIAAMTPPTGHKLHVAEILEGGFADEVQEQRCRAIYKAAGVK